MVFAVRRLRSPVVEAINLDGIRSVHTPQGVNGQQARRTIGAHFGAQPTVTYGNPAALTVVNPLLQHIEVTSAHNQNTTDLPQPIPTCGNLRSARIEVIQRSRLS